MGKVRRNQDTASNYVATGMKAAPDEVLKINSCGCTGNFLFGRNLGCETTCDLYVSYRRQVFIYRLTSPAPDYNYSVAETIRTYGRG